MALQARLAEPRNTLTNDRLHRFFSEDVVENLQYLWTRVATGDVQDEGEEDFLLFEVSQYYAALRVKIDGEQAKRFMNRLYPCGGDLDLAKVNIGNSYIELKLFVERVRSGAWQFILQTLNMVTDILFLFVLLDFSNELFLASLTFLTLSLVFRLVVGLSLAGYVAPGGYRIYILGLFLSLIETSIGLTIIRLSLKKQYSGGFVLYQVGGRVAQSSSRDTIGVLAINSRLSGWAEVLFLFPVVILQDVPMLVIQVLYFLGEEESLDQVFLFAVATTLLHMLFQVAEAIFAFALLRPGGPVDTVQRGREINFVSDNERRDCMDLQCSSLDQKSYLSDVEQICAKYRMTVRKLNFVEASAEVRDEHLETVVQSCPYLTTVALDNAAGISSSAIERFAECKQLRNLWLDCTPVNDEAVEKIALGCQHLRVIGLARTEVTDEGVQALQHCEKIAKIGLDFTSVTDDSLLAILNRCRNLNGLWLSSTQISERTIIEASAQAGLREIHLDDLTCTTDVALNSLAENCPLLQHLSLNRSQVTKPALRSLLTACIYIRTLELDELGFVDDELVVELAEVNVALESISLANTGVQDEGVEALLRINTLKEINVDGLELGDVSLAAIEAFRAR